MLSEIQIQQGIDLNNDRARDALKNQLFILYRRIVPTTGMVRYILQFPQAANFYLLEYINISIPANANLNNFFFVAYSDSGILKYVSENLRRGTFGAKLNLFTSPGADNDPATAGDQKQYLGMLPIGIAFKGTETVTLDFRGAGIAALNYIDVMVYGHQVNRISKDGGFYGSI